MGEAKRRKQARRKMFFDMIEEWSFAPSEWESKTVRELEIAPKVIVRRYPDEILETMRMKARQCHVNCQFMEENDPEGIVKKISGWYPREDSYILHSVILQQDGYACVTPMPYDNGSEFEFIPDPKIVWTRRKDTFVASRDGMEIGPGIRSNPKQVIAKLQDMKTKLEAGADPLSFNTPI